MRSDEGETSSTEGEINSIEGEINGDEEEKSSDEGEISSDDEDKSSEGEKSSEEGEKSSDKEEKSSDEEEKSSDEEEKSSDEEEKSSDEEEIGNDGEINSNAETSSDEGEKSSNGERSSEDKGDCYKGSNDYEHNTNDCSDTGILEEDVFGLSNEDNNWAFNPELFKPIYEDAPITLFGALCGIMEFKRSCNLTFSCIKKLLNLLQLFCPANNILPLSIHSVKTFFQKFSSVNSKHLYCSNCEVKLSDMQRKCDKEPCRKHEPNILYSFNVSNSIKRIMKNNFNVLQDSTRSSSVISDINTQGYSDKPGIIINTDGISPFKSSRLTIWPVIIAFSNLPPNIRMNKKNLLTVSLWVGVCKPKMDILFEPLVDLLQKLSRNGVVVETPLGNHCFKFSPILGIFDLVAKAPILNMNQFNGVNGCPTCLHPGLWISSRYYLPGTEYPLRTAQSIHEASERAERENKIVQGIKGKSVLSDILDLVKCVPIDYMHCVLEGVTKWLINRWFTSTNHRSPFYIGRHIKNIDIDIIRQCPPHDFSRSPRNLSKYLKHWKANEFKYWLLYYSLPLLVKYLPPLYFHHYALLVCSIHILLQTKLKETQIKAAEQMLLDYYTLLPELYGDKSCTLNAHSLTHLCLYVRLWGPLWSHSLLGFESYNGHITSMIHSKYRVAEQLAFSIDVNQTIGCLEERLVQAESDTTLKYIMPLSGINFERKQMKLILPGIYSIGEPLKANFKREEVSALRKVTHQCSTNILTFNKLYFHDTVFISFTNENRKRNSAICCFVLNGEKRYGIIQSFCFYPPLVLIKPYEISSGTLLAKSGNPGRNRLQKYAELNLLSTFFIEVGKLLPVCAIPISSIVCKCVLVSSSQLLSSYIIPIPNHFEHH